MVFSLFSESARVICGEKKDASLILKLFAGGSNNASPSLSLSLSLPVSLFVSAAVDLSFPQEIQIPKKRNLLAWDTNADVANSEGKKNTSRSKYKMLNTIQYIYI